MTKIIYIFVVGMLLGAIYLVVSLFIVPLFEILDEVAICREESSCPVIQEQIQKTEEYEKVDMELTCYCLTENLMASNLPTGIGAIAVDPNYYNVLRIDQNGNVLRSGDIFHDVDNNQYFIALDVGGNAVRGFNRGDVWFPDCEFCAEFGVKYEEMEIFKAPTQVSEE